MAVDQVRYRIFAQGFKDFNRFKGELGDIGMNTDAGSAEDLPFLTEAPVLNGGHRAVLLADITQKRGDYTGLPAKHIIANLGIERGDELPILGERWRFIETFPPGSDMSRVEEVRDALKGDFSGAIYGASYPNSEEGMSSARMLELVGERRNSNALNAILVRQITGGYATSTEELEPFASF